MANSCESPIGNRFARRYSRFKVSAPVVVERGTDEVCLGMTYNAAVGGCCLVVSDAIYWSLGEELHLTFEDEQRAKGKIRWIDRTLIAVEFETPFNRLILDDAATPIVITAAQKQPALASQKAGNKPTQRHPRHRDLRPCRRRDDDWNAL